jgi:hypothetical protein
MVSAVKRAMNGPVASKLFVVVTPDGACVGETINGRAVNRTIMIPSVVQLNQQVGFYGVVTDGPNEATLGRLSAYK